MYNLHHLVFHLNKGNTELYRPTRNLTDQQGRERDGWGGYSLAGG